MDPYSIGGNMANDEKGHPLGFGLNNPAMFAFSPIGDADQVLNRGLITVKYSCSVSQDCECCQNNSPNKFSIKANADCLLEFTYTDSFNNPLDRGDPDTYRYGEEWEKKYQECVKGCPKYPSTTYGFGSIVGSSDECINNCKRLYGSTELPGGTPYTITASWNEKKNFSISRECSQK